MVTSATSRFSSSSSSCILISTPHVALNKWLPLVLGCTDSWRTLFFCLLRVKLCQVLKGNDSKKINIRTYILNSIYVHRKQSFVIVSSILNYFGHVQIYTIPKIIKATLHPLHFWSIYCIYWCICKSNCLNRYLRQQPFYHFKGFWRAHTHTHWAEIQAKAQQLDSCNSVKQNTIFLPRFYCF